MQLEIVVDMAKKMTKDQVKSKKKYHKKRVDFYDKKLKEIQKDEKRIGFRWYD